MTEHIEHARWEAFLNDFAKRTMGLTPASRSLVETLVTRTWRPGYPSRGSPMIRII